MNAHDQSAPPVMQAVHHVDFPERLAAVQHLAEQARGQSLQLGLPTGRVQLHSEDVARDVEVRVELPGGMPEVEGRWHGDLPVAWNEVQFGIDIGNEFAERYRAIENPDGGDVQRYLFSFQIEEGRVDSGQTAAQDRQFSIRLLVGSP